MFGMGTSELILIFVVIVLFFGAKKLPELARGLGKGIREFKDAMSGVQNEIKDSINDVKKDTEIK